MCDLPPLEGPVYRPPLEGSDYSSDFKALVRGCVHPVAGTCTALTCAPCHWQGFGNEVPASVNLILTHLHPAANHTALKPEIRM
jgi:hypothetical protein